MSSLKRGGLKALLNPMNFRTPFYKKKKKTNEKDKMTNGIRVPRI